MVVVVIPTAKKTFLNFYKANMKNLIVETYSEQSTHVVIIDSKQRSKIVGVAENHISYLIMAFTNVKVPFFPQQK